MFGRDGTRNAVSPEKHPPLDWSIGGWDWRTERWNREKSRNIKWRARLGYYTFGSPIVANGQVYIGTTGAGGHVKRHPDTDRYGYLHCFRAADGKFLWHYSAKELEDYFWVWSHRGLGSSPLVEGNRLWFVTNRWEVICLDTDGFHDNEDDGPIKAERRRLFNVVQPPAGLSGIPGKDHLHDSLEALKREQVTLWLRRQFNQAGIQLPQDAKVETEKDGEHWTITARVRGQHRRFDVHKETRSGSHLWLAFYVNTSIVDKEEADIVWRYDLRKELKVHPFSHLHWNPNRQCSPVSYGNRLYVVTGNGTEPVKSPHRRPPVWSASTRRPAKCCGRIPRREKIFCAGSVAIRWSSKSTARRR